MQRKEQIKGENKRRQKDIKGEKDDILKDIGKVNVREKNNLERERERDRA